MELVDYFVEGVVHITSLDDDRYSMEEGGMAIGGRRSKRRFKIGDRVRISVEDVDVPNREIVFELV